MKIYLAGSGWNRTCWEDFNFYDFNRLESFVYIKGEEKNIPKYKSFLLDSGAFTFMKMAKNNSINWDDYVIKYAQFIKQYDVKLFFELDIDNLVGLQEVERLRDLLEKETGRKCIPVWHKSRGLEYWDKMISEYDYVAVGGIVTKEIKREHYDIFHTLIRMAKEKNCRVHGLGFTSIKGMQKYKFYSVDSTAWLSGNRFGGVCRFNGKTMEKYKRPEGYRMKHINTAINNFNQWVKFAKYADANF